MEFILTASRGESHIIFQHKKKKKKKKKNTEKYRKVGNYI